MRARQWRWASRCCGTRPCAAFLTWPNTIRMLPTMCSAAPRPPSPSNAVPTDIALAGPCHLHRPSRGQTIEKIACGWARQRQWRRNGWRHSVTLCSQRHAIGRRAGAGNVCRLPKERGSEAPTFCQRASQPSCCRLYCWEMRDKLKELHAPCYCRCSAVLAAPLNLPSFSLRAVSKGDGPRDSHQERAQCRLQIAAGITTLAGSRRRNVVRAARCDHLGKSQTSCSN